MGRRQRTERTHSWVQSCISVIAFSDVFEELESFLIVDEESEEVMGWKTDIDLLLYPEEEFTWTAPRWITEGDILFFYHTKNAKRSIAKLLKEAGRITETVRKGTGPRSSRRDRQNLRSMEQIVRLLEHAAEQAERYSGRIFACSEVAGPTEYLEDEFERHFSSRHFAPVGRVLEFGEPLDADRFAEFVKIGQSTSNTPLYEPQFEGLKRQLSEGNALPGFLLRARIGGKTFRDADQENWPSISCGAEARFVNEAQLRAYLLDFLLEEIKDPGSPLLRECECVRDGAVTGIADYFLKVEGRWVPVEAKLNVLASREGKLLDQVGKYVDVDSFTPTLGRGKGRRYGASPSSLCLVVDQSGVYVISNGGFRGCSPGRPVWSRGELGHDTAAVIRERIAEEIGSTTPRSSTPQGTANAAGTTSENPVEDGHRGVVKGSSPPGAAARPFSTPEWSRTPSNADPRQGAKADGKTEPGGRVKEPLGQVQLRNLYLVYENGGSYTVVGESPRGRRYECEVRREAVSYLCQRMAGQRVNAEQAGATLQPVAERFDLPYTYGDKLRYSGQYVLLAAVASGRAMVAKERRSYVYSIGNRGKDEL